MPTYGRGGFADYQHLRDPLPKPQHATSAKDWRLYDEAHPVPDVPLPGEARAVPVRAPVIARDIPSAVLPRIQATPIRQRRVDPEDDVAEPEEPVIEPPRVVEPARKRRRPGYRPTPVNVKRMAREIVTEVLGRMFAGGRR